jgi:hypothetical protein
VAAPVEEEVAEEALAAEVEADELDELLVDELRDPELPQAPAPIPRARQERMLTRRRTPASLPGWPGARAGLPRRPGRSPPEGGGGSTGPLIYIALSALT